MAKAGVKANADSILVKAGSANQAAVGTGNAAVKVGIWGKIQHQVSENKLQ